MTTEIQYPGLFAQCEKCVCANTVVRTGMPGVYKKLDQNEITRKDVKKLTIFVDCRHKILRGKVEISLNVHGVHVDGRTFSISTDQKDVTKKCPGRNNR